MKTIIKNIYWKGMLLLTAFLYPVLSFADIHKIPPSPFAIAKNDVSFGMLTQIFGNVGNVIPGTLGIFNAMFKEFNHAIMVLAVIVVVYTFIIAVVNTVKNGEFLGGKMDSVWVPIRMTLGVGLVIPGAGGYSIIQILMMWVVVQGIGAADQLWNGVLDYFQNSALFNVPSQNSSSSSSTMQSITNPAVFSAAKDALMNLVCMHQLYQMNNPGATMASDNLQPVLQTVPAPLGMRSSFQYTFKAPVNPASNGLTGDCGSLTFPGGALIPPTSPTPSSPSVSEAYQSGFATMMKELNGVAKTYVYATTKPDASSSNYMGTSNPLFVSSNDLAIDVQEAESAASKNVTGQNSDQLNTAWITQDVKDKGWANAGLYYFSMASELKSQSVYNIDLQGVTVQEQNVCTSANVSRGASPDPCDGAMAFSNALYNDSLIQSLAGNVSSDGQNSSQESTQQQNQLKVVINNLSESLQEFGLPTLRNFNNPGGLLSQVGELLSYGIATAIMGYPTVTPFDPKTGLFGSNSGVHPIIQIAMIGNNLCIFSEVAYAVMLVATLAFGIAAVIATDAFVGFAAAWPVFKFMGLPLAALVGVLYTAGLTMSIYVPLIPFIIFTIGVIGWLIAVIETMLAAPMVAIGLAYPDGQHEVLGRAEPAIQLLANVFLRPSLMLFGLIAGLLVSYVAINFLSTLFGLIVTALSNAYGGSGTVLGIGQGLGPVQDTILLITYISFVIAILNQSFALIHIFPDRILSWIGWQAQFGEYSRETEKGVRGGFDKGVEGAKHVGSSVASAGSGAVDNELFHGKGKAWADKKRGLEVTPKPK